MKTLALLSSLVLVAQAAPPLSFLGSETATPAADGGLRPLVGVHNVQAYRANRSQPTHLDGLRHTYLHQPMLAWWKGRFYLEYLSAPRHEHDTPTDTSVLSSADGVNWDPPRTVFPAVKLADGSFSITHQRMGFHVTADGRLFALAFHGHAPSPNDGTGFGRVVREIKADGDWGPIYVIKPGARPRGGEVLPYPDFTTSPDEGFVAACRALLSNLLITAQWWEEDALDESGFYRVKGKALSYVTRPDGSVLGIWKNRLVSVTRDGGRTWEEKQPAGNVPNNASKYWLQRTSDQRYALFLNPTERLRHPLAAMVSEDSAQFSGLFAVHGELPDQRFGGAYKNLGPQYVRGIAEGDGTPPDSAQATWVTYSVNKEDLWVARVPVPLRSVVEGPVAESFDAAPAGSLPAGWNVYSPLWAPVRVVAEGTGHALELKDEDPYDYASVTRVFPASHGLRASLRFLARQTSQRLEIELVDAKGLRPVRVALEPDGKVWASHEGQWSVVGSYAVNTWHTLVFEIPSAATADRCAITLDGRTELSRPAIFADPAVTVERLTIRTGPYRYRGEGGRDLPGADVKVSSSSSSFLIDDVSLVPVP